MANISNAYKVRIVSQSRGTIRAYLPNAIQIGVSAGWESPFENAIGERFSSTVSGLLSLFKVSTHFQGLSAQTWTGSSPIVLTLPLELYAEENAAKEVSLVIRDLMSLALPEIREGALGNYIPPGPTIESLKGDEGSTHRGDVIHVQVGKFLRFKNVVVEGVDSNIDALMSVDGQPMKATASITFRTYTTISKSDLDAMFTAS